MGHKSEATKHKLSLFDEPIADAYSSTYENIGQEASWPLSPL